MKLHQRLKFWQKPLSQSFVLNNEPIVSIEIPQPKGHVVKAKPAEYNPDTTRQGGRVVKAMPRELRKVKEAQELVPDDAPVQQLPD